MISSKHMPRVVAVMVCICLIICGLIVYAAGAYDTARITEYQKRLFGDEVISLEIQVDESDWQSLLNNAQAKEWISGDLIINGERFNAVGIRTKGNSSLSQGRNGRYSLQFKFNKYVEGQTYYGLDAFCVNNMMGDATYMKDYISYEIMDYIGVDTPLTNYAAITVNGADYCFGIALERYDEAFLDRVYNTSAGELYSVKISMGNRGDFENRWQDVENTLPGARQNNNSDAAGGIPDPSQGGGGFPGLTQDRGMGGGFGGFGGNGGGSLLYTGDDPADYSSIFDNVVMGTASDKDKERVITAIKNLNAGTDLEKYFDVDGALRYFAAHTVVVNLDSYISNMQQNYYLYERDGKITILPWDYGLAFGGFQSGGASGVVNFPIDTPVSGVAMEDRPLLNVLLESDEYCERYHAYLLQIVEGYFESGLFESSVNALDAKIGEYVKNDSSAFFTYEQYKAALPELVKIGQLRAESIRGQLDGTIPSTSAGQNADGSALIDASGVNMSALGSSMGGGGMGQGGRNFQAGQQPEAQGNAAQNGGFAMPDMGLMQQAMQILAEAGGELTDEARAALLELGLPEEQIDMFLGMQNAMPGGMGQEGAVAGGGIGDVPAGGNGNIQGDRQERNDFMPENMPFGNEPRASPEAAGQTGAGAGYAVLTGVSLLLAGAIAFVAKPRKDVI